MTEQRAMTDNQLKLTLGGLGTVVVALGIAVVVLGWRVADLRRQIAGRPDSADAIERISAVELTVSNHDTLLHPTDLAIEQNPDARFFADIFARRLMLLDDENNVRIALIPDSLLSAEQIMPKRSGILITTRTGASSIQMQNPNGKLVTNLTGHDNGGGLSLRSALVPADQSGGFQFAMQPAGPEFRRIESDGSWTVARIPFE